MINFSKLTVRNAWHSNPIASGLLRFGAVGPNHHSVLPPPCVSATRILTGWRLPAWREMINMINERNERGEGKCYLEIVTGVYLTV